MIHAGQCGQTRVPLSIGAIHSSARRPGERHRRGDAQSELQRAGPTPGQRQCEADGALGSRRDRQKPANLGEAQAAVLVAVKPDNAELAAARMAGSHRRRPRCSRLCPKRCVRHRARTARPDDHHGGCSPRWRRSRSAVVNGGTSTPMNHARPVRRLDGVEAENPTARCGFRDGRVAPMSIPNTSTLRRVRAVKSVSRASRDLPFTVSP